MPAKSNATFPMALSEEANNASDGALLSRGRGRRRLADTKKRKPSQIDDVMEIHSPPKKNKPNMPTYFLDPDLPLNAEIKKCGEILIEIMNDQEAAPFNHPVDTMIISDYKSVIRWPMDLGAVKRKLESGQYQTPAAFESDVCKVWGNALTYNPPEDQYHRMAHRLGVKFQREMESIFPPHEFYKPLPIPDVYATALDSTSSGTESSTGMKLRNRPNRPSPQRYIPAMDGSDEIHDIRPRTRAERAARRSHQADIRISNSEVTYGPSSGISSSSSSHQSYSSQSYSSSSTHLQSNGVLSDSNNQLNLTADPKRPELKLKLKLKFSNDTQSPDVFIEKVKPKPPIHQRQLPQRQLLPHALPAQRQLSQRLKPSVGVGVGIGQPTLLSNVITHHRANTQIVRQQRVFGRPPIPPRRGSSRAGDAPPPPPPPPPPYPTSAVQWPATNQLQLPAGYSQQMLPMTSHHVAPLVSSRNAWSDWSSPAQTNASLQ